jgi:hypothetical protein
MKFRWFCHIFPFPAAVSVFAGQHVQIDLLAAPCSTMPVESKS